MGKTLTFGGKYKLLGKKMNGILGGIRLVKGTLDIYWTVLTPESNVGVPGSVSRITTADNPDNKNSH